MTSEPDISMTMRDLLERLPSARRALFARYHLGGCQGCAFGNEETLAELCEREGLDPQEVMAHLLASEAQEVAMWLDPECAQSKRAEFQFVDVRTREEHEAVQIAGSVLLTQELQQALFAGDPTRKLLLYDHQGRSVLDQVAWFRGHGLEQTYALRGGIDAWSRLVEPSLPRYRVELDD